MAAVGRRMRNLYGASLFHLLTLLATLALAAYAGVHTLRSPSWPLILAWFVGAVVGHDLVLVPLYALADRSLVAALRRARPSALTVRRDGAMGRKGASPAERVAVSPLNYLRVPALAAALLFLVFFPGIVRQGSTTYRAATGQTQQPFLGRWLLLTAAVFALGAVSYVAALLAELRRAHRAQRAAAHSAVADGRVSPR